MDYAWFVHMHTGVALVGCSWFPAFGVPARFVHMGPVFVATMAVLSNSAGL